MERLSIHLPDRDLAYFEEGTQYLTDYVEAVDWAQRYSMRNREVMMERVLAALGRHLPPFKVVDVAVNCHHNYVQRERHFGSDVWITRKGAIRAGTGELGIIPGSMGAKSYIVRGKGASDSFESCAHGAGRRMSRTEAKRRFTTKDLLAQTEGIICRKDAAVVDEIPGAYKDIDNVMAQQSDLVEVVHTLKQLLCIKG
jgi:tRNA-splicing ligase RtcB